MSVRYALLSRFGPECYEEQEKKAKDLFAKAEKLGTSEGYKRILELYPNSGVIEFCQFALIRQQVERDSFKNLSLQIKKMMQDFPKSQFMPQILFYLFHFIQQLPM